MNLNTGSSFNRLKNCVVSDKNVIVRVDINVPIINGKIEDDTRIKAVIPTLVYLAKNQAKVIVISHFGRPEGKIEPSMSIARLVARVQELLGSIKVHFVDDCIGEKVQKAVAATNYGEVIMLENLRFYEQETKNDAEFSRQLASFANLYVNDAFSCSHRAHASIVGIPAILKSAAGFQMETELDNLNKIFANGSNNLIAAIGGAKVSSKIDLLNSLASKAQTIVVGGGMANTFLYASGKNIGKSLCEKELKDVALKIIETAKQHKCRLILPSDVVVVKKFEANAPHKTVVIDEVSYDDIIVDLGKNSIKNLGEELKKHRILVWNGPFGAFELKPFNLGTEGFAHIAAELTKAKKLISIAGGGDSVSAINSAGLANDFTYISTAGGAFLEWLEGKNLPGIMMLTN
ncbi:MAG: phosphoglycerate kinase [Alphaproteobacteria bacterium RIFCSPLOWO2_01_FULL_40_26]|nr:MAG: phosphoglycerate kinase [Alphaproteobacteria bacterium RIFCSPHIGHO2_02_FULL_40_34]OFW88373.1 MAG: phosphoglycerate kinase [Alphaproteobacteria bacterium RIFCSPHIGHO2_01_FULL_40_8]OFW94327.1 MAG: phosphoglycerate kinase [Alphaproteobacteria bacterium RIFCSPLOWO2_01_FULL_40_26]OFX10019.1 MAG: phosphoglycerate kinase [Alphaproteobacteria bacterium RIFCSPLOWO2_02_FULL_40_19]OFX11091.1 MAG: phosphoglycerate kinase [Alphaproteobacteria bacterium RIFCSPLOWO2_12_FULL_40_11]